VTTPTGRRPTPPETEGEDGGVDGEAPALSGNRDESRRRG
jgi:hypothetical protein